MTATAADSTSLLLDNGDATPVRVPDLTGCDAQGVAIAMAASGFRIFRLRKAEKAPLLSERWSEVSTTDLTTVAEWFREGDYSVGLDLYRSGLFCYDIDKPLLLDDSTRRAFRENLSAFQSTRDNERGRGHLLYALPWDNSIEDYLRVGCPKIRNASGEVVGEHKGFNAYISLGPDHEKADDGGRYQFLSRDIVGLPQVLLDALPVFQGSATAEARSGTDALPAMPGQPNEDMRHAIQWTGRLNYNAVLKLTAEIADYHLAGHPGGDWARKALITRYAVEGGGRSSPERTVNHALAGAFARAGWKP